MYSRATTTVSHGRSTLGDQALVCLSMWFEAQSWRILWRLDSERVSVRVKVTYFGPFWGPHGAVEIQYGAKGKTAGPAIIV